VTNDTPDKSAHRPLPQRPPRPLVLHYVIDSAVVFLALVVVAFFVGFALAATAIAALVIGVPAALWTRQLEEQALAARPSAGGSPEEGSPQPPD
jgi:hypothetical protein